VRQGLKARPGIHKKKQDLQVGGQPRASSAEGKDRARTDANTARESLNQKKVWPPGTSRGVEFIFPRPEKADRVIIKMVRGEEHPGSGIPKSKGGKGVTAHRGRSRKSANRKLRMGRGRENREKGA